MASSAQFSTRSPAVKRLMQEARELQEPTEMYRAAPVDDNLFEWHFTVRGADDTAFAGGLYHGRISLPAEYPMKPPSIMLFTPNGRFQTNTKICLSISGYHPETWLPSWSIRTALLAIIGFMPTPGHGAIGSIDYTDEERKRLAKKSLDWCCSQCKLRMRDALPEPVKSGSNADADEALRLGQQIAMNGPSDKSTASADNTTTAEPADDTSRSTGTSQIDQSTNVTAENIAAEQQLADTTEPPVPRLRRRRRVRTSDESRRATPAVEATTNWSAVLLNVLIVIVTVAIILILYRRTLVAPSDDNDANINDLSLAARSQSGMGETTESPASGALHAAETETKPRPPPLTRAWNPPADADV